MTSALRHILEFRADLRALFDVRTDEGLWHAIAWFYTHGVREYNLAQAADSAVVQALDSTPPFLRNTAVDASPELTWHMFFVWRCSDELQQAYDLRNRSSRLEFLQWFLFEGITNLQLAPFVADRWRGWLRQPIKLEASQPVTMPRAAYLLWQRRADLRKAFDLKSALGQRSMALWIGQAWTTERALNWIQNVHVNRATAAEQRPFGLNLIGFAFGELGIGEDVRMAAEACEAAGIPFSVLNIQPGSNLRQADTTLAKLVNQGKSDDAPFSINLFCLTAFDTARVALERGPSLFEGRYNIGWWPWELPVWPRTWRVAFNLIDEVWAATNFTRQLYSRASKYITAPPRVTLMPLPASVQRVRKYSRKALAVPERKFLFLYVFDFNSYLERKNPFGVVRAFQKAFPPTDNSVGLVLKTMNSDDSNPVWQEFVENCGRDARITLLTRTMDRSKVLGLIASCDAYVSLHRSEGYGRTLAEALLLGKKVIGTNFSGNVDFLNSRSGYPVRWRKRRVKKGEYPFIEDTDNAWWAEPNITDAAAQLNSARQTSREPQELSKNIYSPKRTGAKMAKTLIENCSAYTSNSLYRK